MLAQPTLGPNAGSKAVPSAAMAVVIWVQLVMSLLRPWNNESRATWAELLGYRVNQIYICKNDTMNEHEYTIVDLSQPEQECHLFLRLERAAGTRKGSLLSLPSAPSISLHILNPSSRPSDICSNKYLAADTIEKVDGLPESVRIVRVVEFNSDDRSKRPSLWDLMILSYVIHEGSVTYELFQRQCFWFADTISAILEEWPEASGDISVIDNKARSLHFLKWRQQSGNVGVFAIYRRNSYEIGIIRAEFEKHRYNLYKTCQEFENTWMEDTREKRELQRKLQSVLKERDMMVQREEELVKLVKRLIREREEPQRDSQQWETYLQQRLQQSDQQAVSCC